MNNRVRLSVLGFSFNQNKTGTYGLVLAEENGLRRLMIIVGTPEAQSIAFKLQNTMPPRPLTHDLTCDILNQFEIQVVEVSIYKYTDGVYFSHILLRQNERLIEVESRTSDAVGIALRTNSPIYTTEGIMQEMGIVFDEKVLNKTEEDEIQDTYNKNIQQADYSLQDESQLEAMLKDAINREDYELASVIRDELRKKKDED